MLASCSADQLRHVSQGCARMAQRADSSSLKEAFHHVAPCYVTLRSLPGTEKHAANGLDLH